MSNRERILAKIEKCLALGKSPEPHEAAAALRQAQKLIEKHGVTDEELGAVGYSKETVHTSVQVNRKTVPIRINELGRLIENAFGVNAVIYATKRVSDWSYSIDYYGPKNRVLLAAYSHTVVQKALDGAYKAFIEQVPALRAQRGVRASFELGWLGAVSRAVMDLGITQEEAEGINQALANDNRADLPKVEVRTPTVYQEIAMAGREAGEDFQLHRPIS